MKPKFDQYFAADAWLRLWSLILVFILKLALIKILKFKFCVDACLVEIVKSMLGRDSKDEIWSRFYKNLWYVLNLRAFGNVFFYNFMLKKTCLKVQILQYIFLDWKCPHPLGTFLKIDLFWWRQPSLSERKKFPSPPGTCETTWETSRSNFWSTWS